MKPKLFTEYIISYENENGEIYKESLGHCSEDYLTERIKDIRNNNSNIINSKKDINIDKIYSPKLDKYGYIEEFEDITIEENIYIPTDKNISVFISDKGIEFHFDLYVAGHLKEITIYKAVYLYSQDLIKLNEVNKVLGEVRTNFTYHIITHPKRERIIKSIYGDLTKIYQSFITFLYPSIWDYFNHYFND